jgi:hypothetical protein
MVVGGSGEESLRKSKPKFEEVTREEIVFVNGSRIDGRTEGKLRYISMAGSRVGSA